MSIDIDRMAAMARHGAAAAPDAALALISRLREAEEELAHTQGQRDAAILRAQRAEDGEQALAAHVERIAERARQITDHRAWEGDADPRVPHALLNRLSEACMDAPDHSLARWDARMKADELDDIYRELPGDLIFQDLVDWLKDRAADYRRQAEQADTAKEGA